MESDDKKLPQTTMSQKQDKIPGNPENGPVATTAAIVDQPGGDVAEAAPEATGTDKVVDDWFVEIRKKLSRDTATRNLLFRGLSDLKTRLNEVKA